MDAKHETEPADAPVADPLEPDAEGAAEVDPEADGDGESTDALIARLEAERDEAAGHAERALADYQNLRRRMQQDIDAAVKRARAEVLAETLTVLDYLDMALATECTTEEGKNLKVGVSMTRGQLAALLERFKVREIPATATFDARYQQAFATVETAEHPPGTVVEVLRKGWTMGDQVLRYAQVRVAATPTVVEPPASDATPTDEAVSDESRDRLSD